MLIIFQTTSPMGEGKRPVQQTAAEQQWNGVGVGGQLFVMWEGREGRDALSPGSLAAQSVQSVPSSRSHNRSVRACL